MRYFSRNYRMNVKIHHSSIILRVSTSWTGVPWKYSVAVLHARLVTIKSFGMMFTYSWKIKEKFSHRSGQKFHRSGQNAPPSPEEGVSWRINLRYVFKNIYPTCSMERNIENKCFKLEKKTTNFLLFWEIYP